MSMHPWLFMYFAIGALYGGVYSLAIYRLPDGQETLKKLEEEGAPDWLAPSIVFIVGFLVWPVLLIAGLIHKAGKP